MSYRDLIIEEMGYVICPISSPEYQCCNEKCDECETYIEFKKSFENS